VYLHKGFGNMIVHKAIILINRTIMMVIEKFFKQQYEKKGMVRTKKLTTSKW